MTSHATRSRWAQINVSCQGWQAAEHTGIKHLGPLLASAEHAGLLASWWFTRKGASWRLRYLPATGQDKHAAATVKHALADLTARGLIHAAVTTIYEPETHAFGGADAMDVAHSLFHADSHHLLTHLQSPGPHYRRELGIMTCALMMRAAGQDWYEQGDIWATVATHRKPGRRLPARPASAEALGQLLTAGTLTQNNPLRNTPAWPAAFQRTGHDLTELAQHGTLTRGLRAVLAHHILFTWNRAGIPAHQQAALAAGARDLVFHQQPRHLPRPHVPVRADAPS